MPRKLRQLLKELRQAGFDLISERGDHRKFERGSVSVVVRGALGDDVLPYQEKQIRAAIAAAQGTE